jgi:hypothetical protein
MSPKERLRLKYLVLLEQHNAVSQYEDDQDSFLTAIEEKIEKLESLEEASIGLDALGYIFDSLSWDEWDTIEDMIHDHELYSNNKPNCDKFMVDYPTDAVVRYKLQPSEIPKNRFLEDGARKPSDKLANYL